MSIFQKDCPECAASNPVDAVSCRCGYCFDPEALARTDPVEYAHQQDRLYRDYLAARIAQAEAELLVARELARDDPENTYKASNALLAEQALNALQAEMRQVMQRIAAAPRRPANAAPPLAAAPSKAPSRHAAPLPPAKPPVAPKPTAAPKPAAKAVAPKQAAKPVRAPAGAPAPLARPSLPAAAKPAAVAPPRQNPPPAPAISAKPSETFKRQQAQRAEAIARAKAPAAPKRHAPVPPVKRAAPAVARPSADIPALTLPGSKATQDCPNCTATVPLDRERCGCGYTFSRASEQVPAITLDAAALAILTEGISASKRSPR